MRKSRALWLAVVGLSVLSVSQPVGATTGILVHFQAQSGHYVVAESGGYDLLYADRTAPGSWETFYISDYNDGNWVSGDEVGWELSYNALDIIATVTYPYGIGYPVCGGSTIGATNSGLNNCRKFYIYKVDNDGNILWDETINDGDQVAISSYDGLWMSANYGGGSNVTIDRTAIGPWEKFFVTVICKGC